jgi:hypothetical protein
MDNVEKRNICTNVPSSQTFRSHLQIWLTGTAFVSACAKRSAWGHVVFELHVHKPVKEVPGLYLDISLFPLKYHTVQDKAIQHYKSHNHG